MQLRNSVLVLWVVLGVGCAKVDFNQTAPATACKDGTGTYYSSTANPPGCIPWVPCTPGKYVRNTGTATSNPECKNCDYGTYSSTRDAVKCNAWSECVAGQYVEQKGTTTSDRVCATWSECVAGQYVEQGGTMASDRRCAACEDGTYSRTANALLCSVWTVCDSGQYVKQKGTTTSDRVCAACDDENYSNTSVEECNRQDDDCDGTIDEDAVRACESVMLNADTDCVAFANTARCVLVKCRDGFGNCDGNPANGCEPFCMCNECSDAGDEDVGP